MAYTAIPGKAIPGKASPGWATDVQSRAFGQATETDVANAFRLPIPVRKATESDTAQAIRPVRSRAFGQATEADSATTFNRQKVRSFGQAVETDTAQAIRSGEFHGIGQASETNVAQSITPAVWVFYPPTVDDVPNTSLQEGKPPSNALLKHYARKTRGRNVVKESGAYTTVDTVTQARLDAADLYYLGGHRYVVTAAERAALVAAGYTVVLENA